MVIIDLILIFLLFKTCSVYNNATLLHHLFIFIFFSKHFGQMSIVKICLNGIEHFSADQKENCSKNKTHTND